MTGVKDSIPVSDRDKPARKKLKEADQSSKRHKKSKERKVRGCESVFILQL